MQPAHVASSVRVRRRWDRRNNRHAATALARSLPPDPALNRCLFCRLVFTFVRGVTVCARTRVPAMFGCIRVLLTAACVLGAVVACTLDVVRGFPLVSTFAVP